MPIKIKTTALADEKVQAKTKTRQRACYPTEFRQYAVDRFKECGNATALAEELGIRRKFLYQWRAQFAAGLIPPRLGRPPKRLPPRPGLSGSTDALRIADLERLVARQAQELDFFRMALPHLDATRTLAPPATGATACTPVSGPACRSKAD